MATKNIFYYVLISFIILGCCYKKRYNNSIQERLDQPFGTLLNLEIEIIDGDSTHWRLYEGDFLMKINRIEKKKIRDSLVLPFKDKSGKFPANDFELFKFLNNRDTGIISSEQRYKMKKLYVGKKFNIIAYESGEFDGIPRDYFNYHPSEDVIGFHFQNFLVVVTDSSKVD